MAANQPQQASTSAAPSQEYIVRVSRDVKKKHSIIKFNPSNNVDFTKGAKATLQRENNFKEFKNAYDIDAMPKFGAGSEFGREAREEARRKKYGIKSKVYVPNAQPWTMKLTPDATAKAPRKFKGIKEGGVLENTSYYIFTQCPDGAFEAFPVEEWYNFTPIARYKVLNSEEAEREFERREQRQNYFNIMVSKRMKKDEDADDGKEVDEDGKKVKKSKKKDFVLTELDEWAVLSDDESENDSEQSGSEKKEKKEKKKKKPTKKKSGKKSRKTNSDSEAMEESDDMDEGKEVDYMTDSDSEDDDMYADRAKMKSDKYDDKGVVEEDGLRKLIDSDEDEEDEKKAEDDAIKDEEGEEGKDAKRQKGSDSESSSSSDSDSDVEKAASLPSALFMKKAEKVSKKNKSAENTPTNSRSATPTILPEEKSKKRKAETDSVSSKKARVSTPTPTVASGAGASDGITEELVRRYLMRKPMTTKELLIKFRNTGLSKEARVTQLAQILKRLNPDKKKIQDQLYLSIKKPE